jgi:hypothetical protein
MRSLLNAIKNVGYVLGTVGADDQSHPLTAGQNKIGPPPRLRW